MNHNHNGPLHAELHRTGLMAQKPALAQSFSQGRTSTTKELSSLEALELIAWLKQQPSAQPPPTATGTPAPKASPPAGGPGGADRMRKKIIAMHYKLGWAPPGTKANMQRINDWCTKQFGKKPLNDYTAAELPKLVSIFEKMLYQHLNRI